MATGDLTTLASVKSYLGIAGTADDALLASMVTGCSAAIRSYVNRDFVQQTYTDLLNGTGGARLSLPSYPVVSVSAVSVCGQAQQPSADGWTQPGFAFDDRGVSLIGSRFPIGRRNVSVTYVAGFAVVPNDVAQACTEWVAFKYRERDRIGHQSKSVQGETVAFVVRDMPPFVATMLAQYKKVVPT